MNEQRVISYRIDVDDAPVKSLKQQLREATLEAQRLATAEIVDEKALQAAIQKTAELKDQMMDVNEQVAELAAGSPFEKMKNSIGGVQGALMNLDFDKATTSAKALTNTITNLNPATMAAHFSAFGGTVMQLSKAVGMLTIKFVQMGVALLTNPIFLLAAAIAAVVAGVVILLNKLGMLQPILDALMKPIRMLIDGFYAITDALGLTNKAGEETRKEVEKSIAAYEEQAAALKKTNSQEEFIANDKLRRLKAMDDGTKEYAEKIKKYERELLQMKVNNFKEEVKLAEDQMLLMLAKGAISKAEFEKQKQQIIDLKMQMRTAATDLFEFENKKPTSVGGAKKDGKSTKPEKVEEDPEVKYRLARARFIEDIEIDMIANEEARNIKQQQVRIKRAQEDLEASKIWETYTAEQQIMIAQKAQDDIQAIQDKFDADKKAKKEADDLALLEQFKAFNATEQSILQDKFDSELDMLRAFLDAELLTEEEYAAKRLELENKLADDLIDVESRKAQKKQELIDMQIAAEQNLQDARMGILFAASDIIKDFAGQSKAMAVAGLAVEKGAAIADVIIKGIRERAAITAKYALVPGGQLAMIPELAASRIRTGLSIATIAATGLQSAMSGGSASSSGGGGSSPSMQTPSMGQATPQINMFGNEQNPQQPLSGVNKVTVVDYTDIQNMGNNVTMLQNAVSLG
jgi:hypothetical protein